MGTAHLYIDDCGHRVRDDDPARLTFADGSALTLWYQVDGVSR